MTFLSSVASGGIWFTWSLCYVRDRIWQLNDAGWAQSLQPVCRVALSGGRHNKKYLSSSSVGREKVARFGQSLKGILFYSLPQSLAISVTTNLPPRSPNIINVCTWQLWMVG
jgi:hypothetical protein